MSAAALRLIRRDGPPSPARLRLVASAPRTSRMALVLLIVAAIGVFGVVSVGAMTAEAAVSVRELETDVDDLKRRYELLVADVAELESPDRIRREARRAGMVEADDPTFLVVDGNGRFALHDPADGTVDTGFTDKVKQVLATQP
jgi:cell division protein FtsL